MEFGRYVKFSLGLFALLTVAECFMIIPAAILSPLGVPAIMGPAALMAVKLAIGTKLLNLLGTLGTAEGSSLLANPIETLQRYPFMGFNFQQYEQFPGAQMRSASPKQDQFAKRRGPNIPTSFNIREATPTEIENFFGVLERVDANKCISRLVCEIGANPKIVEGLGHNVKEVISSMRILEKNKLSTKYREILFQGQKRGLESCSEEYETCDDKSYRLVKTFVRAFRIKRNSISMNN